MTPISRSADGETGIFSLIKFKLPAKNSDAVFAGVMLLVQNYEQETVPLYVDRIIDPWKWDLTKQIWWKDRPGGFRVISERYPAPHKLHWYVVEITRLYKQWDSGAIGNFGFQIRPSSNYGSILRFTNNPSLQLQVSASTDLRKRMIQGTKRNL